MPTLAERFIEKRSKMSQRLKKIRGKFADVEEYTSSDDLKDVPIIFIGDHSFRNQDIVNLFAPDKKNEETLILFKKVFQNKYPITRHNGIPRVPSRDQDRNLLVDGLNNYFNILRGEIIELKKKGDNVELREKIEHLQKINILITHFKESKEQFPYEKFKEYLSNKEYVDSLGDIDEGLKYVKDEEKEEDRVRNLLRQFIKVYLQNNKAQDFSVHGDGIYSDQFKEFKEEYDGDDTKKEKIPQVLIYLMEILEGEKIKVPDKSEYDFTHIYTLLESLRDKFAEAEEPKDPDFPTQDGGRIPNVKKEKLEDTIQEIVDYMIKEYIRLRTDYVSVLLESVEKDYTIGNLKSDLIDEKERCEREKIAYGNQWKETYDSAVEETSRLIAEKDDITTAYGNQWKGSYESKERELKSKEDELNLYKSALEERDRLIIEARKVIDEARTEYPTSYEYGTAWKDAYNRNIKGNSTAVENQLKKAAETNTILSDLFKKVVIVKKLEKKRLEKIQKKRVNPPSRTPKPDNSRNGLPTLPSVTAELDKIELKPDEIISQIGNLPDSKRKELIEDIRNSSSTDNSVNILKDLFKNQLFIDQDWSPEVLESNLKAMIERIKTAKDINEADKIFTKQSFNKRIRWNPHSDNNNSYSGVRKMFGSNDFEEEPEKPDEPNTPISPSVRETLRTPSVRETLRTPSVREKPNTEWILKNVGIKGNCFYEALYNSALRYYGGSIVSDIYECFGIYNGVENQEQFIRSIRNSLGDKILAGIYDSTQIKLYETLHDAAVTDVNGTNPNSGQFGTFVGTFMSMRQGFTDEIKDKYPNAQAMANETKEKFYKFLSDIVKTDGVYASEYDINLLKWILNKCNSPIHINIENNETIGKRQRDLDSIPKYRTLNGKRTLNLLNKDENHYNYFYEEIISQKTPYFSLHKKNHGNFIIIN